MAGVDRDGARARAAASPCCRSTASTTPFTSACTGASPRHPPADPHRVGRAVPRTAGRAPARRHARRRAAPPDVDDGAEDHHRFGDADEQGARGHRGALAVRRRAGADRRRRPSAVDRALDGRARRRLDHRAARRHRHAAADSVRVLVSGALGGAARRRSIWRAPAGSSSSRRTRRGFPAWAWRSGRSRATSGLPIVLNAANEVAVAAFLDASAGLYVDSRRHRAVDGRLRTERPGRDFRAWTTSGPSIGGRGSSPLPSSRRSECSRRSRPDWPVR